MKRWINTKVVLEWNGSTYIEKTVDGYWYDGEMALCDVTKYAGEGGGGAGGAGGNGGIVIFITSNLSIPFIDTGHVTAQVGKGLKGNRGATADDGSTWGYSGAATDGKDGKYIEIIM